MLGLEVDGVEPVAGAFNNVVVGEVVECHQHPDADKLRVTKVNVGEPELLDIVCGAPNCRQGLKVCVAKVGAVLPGDFKIKPAKLRGQPSNGMLCSWSELGINIESSGIIELPADAPIGEDVREYLKLDDVVIEIGLTANRPDCLSPLGISRDLAAKYGTEHYFEHFVADLNKEDKTTITDTFPVEIENLEACPAFTCRVIRNVNVNAQTPMWMVQFLAKVGVRSIDPIVDITNYVMHLVGQPLHAFDLNRLKDKIIVRNAKDGEKLTLLSGEVAELKENTLLICDGNGPLSLAGIFGGENSGINSETKDILIECAHFNPLAIVNRARQYGLHTDASHRFERGVDPQIMRQAMQLCTRLVLEICGGEAGPVNITGEIPANVNQITVKHALIERIAGISYSPETVINILTRLGCTLTNHDQQAGTYTFLTPSWRFDLAIPEDLAEEVIRIDGYEKIPTQAPVAELNMDVHQEANLELNRIKNLLVAKDFQEIVSYSFVDPKLQAYFHKDEPALTLPNPISVEMSQMRLSMFTSLLTTLSYNQKRQQKRVRIFETGLVFIPDATAEMSVKQKPVIAGLISGNREVEGWATSNDQVDFFDAKGVVEDILALTESAVKHNVSFVAKEVQGFHPGQTAAILIDGKEVGVVGKIHPALVKPFAVSANSYLFSLDQEAVSKTHIPDIIPVSKYQANKRDIALIISKDTPVGELLAKARKAGSELLLDVQLFDLFTGEAIGADNKSVALTLTIGSQERTLEDADINAEVERVVQALAIQFNAVLREV